MNSRKEAILLAKKVWMMIMVRDILTQVRGMATLTLVRDMVRDMDTILVILIPIQRDFIAGVARAIPSRQKKSLDTCF